MPDDDVIVAVVLVVMVVAIAFGLFTRKGSGIDEHPDSNKRS